MNLQITGKNIKITDGIRNCVEKEFGKLDRYFKPDTKAYVVLSAVKGRQTVEVTIPVKGKTIRTEQESNDLYVSIDLAEEVIERQMKRYKERIVDRHQNGDAFQKTYIEESVVEEDEIEIVRTKRFVVKPMSPEEACAQMELLGHSFFVFQNAETYETNVVYKRKDGRYGLIGPLTTEEDA